MGQRRGPEQYRNPRTHTQATDELRFTPKHWDPERDTRAWNMLTDGTHCTQTRSVHWPSSSLCPTLQETRGWRGGQGRGCDQGRSQGGRQKAERAARGPQDASGVCSLVLLYESKHLSAIPSQLLLVRPGAPGGACNAPSGGAAGWGWGEGPEWPLADIDQVRRVKGVHSLQTGTWPWGSREGGGDGVQRHGGEGGQATMVTQQLYACPSTAWPVLACGPASPAGAGVPVCSWPPLTKPASKERERKGEVGSRCGQVGWLVQVRLPPFCLAEAPSPSGWCVPLVVFSNLSPHPELPFLKF